MYLYHWIPEGMTGTTLYPLTVLKGIYPKAYEKHAAKYIGRENLMNIAVPTLNCKWNDVLHLTAIPPKEVQEALVAAGLSKRNLTAYKIDHDKLDPEKATIFLYTNNLLEIHSEDFIPFTSENIKNYCTILPDRTKDYYTETTTTDGPVFIYHLCPHVLYKGNIDISDCEIITEE